MKNIATIIALLLLNFASAQVDVRVTILPPYPSKVTDYASRPQQFLIMVRNLGSVAQDVQLRGSITGDNGVALRVDPRYKSPSPIHLNAGQTRQLSGMDISELFDYDQLLFSGITRDQVIRSNGVPEGNYQVCIQAFDYNTNRPLSSGEPIGCSNVFPITSIEPPVILSPFNGSPVSALTTQNFPITWSTPAGAPPSTQYTVSLVEILDNRNPNDAIRTATSPLFFQQTVTSTNLLLYGPAMPALTLGRHYALMVTATDPFHSITFRNNGRSEVTGFVYGDTTLTALSGNSTPAAPRNAGVHVPSDTIRGLLTWYYRQSEQSPPIARSKYTPSSNSPFGMVSTNANALVSAALHDVSFVAAVKPATTILNASYNPTVNPALTNSRVSAITIPSMTQLKAAKPTAPMAVAASSQIARVSPIAINIGGSGLGQLIDNSDPANFNKCGSTPYPVTRTTIKLLAVDTVHPGAAPQLAGTATTDDQGNFQLIFVPPTAFATGGGYKYTLSIPDSYFTLPDLSFSLPASLTNYDLGEVKALANTYRFLPFTVNSADSEITEATVDVYRRADFYTANPSLQTEGNIDPAARTTETIDGQLYIKISSLKDGYTGSRLFYSADNTAEYKVKVTSQHFSPLTTTVGLTTASTHPTTPQTVKKTYRLSAAPTNFSGTVYEVLGQNGGKRPVAGATITLYLTEDAYNKATQSSFAGKLLMPSTNLTGFVSATANTARVTPVTTNATRITTTTRIAAPTALTSITHPSPVAAANTAPAAVIANNPLRVATPATTMSPSALIQNITAHLNTGQITTTTDSLGAFSFSGFSVDDPSMKYVVTVPGSSLSRTDSLPLMVAGASIQREIDFNFVAYAVTGRIVDEKNNPIPNALYVWASGGSYNQADANGYFATSNKAGSDTLIIKKVGYQERHVGITIKGDLLKPEAPPAVAGSGGVNPIFTANPVKPAVPAATTRIPTPVANVSSSVTSYASSLQNTATYKLASSQGHPISAASFGFSVSAPTPIAPTSGISASGVSAISGPSAESSWIGSIVQPKDNTSGAVDFGLIVLKKKTGRMLITITDASNKPLPNAVIQIDGTDSTELTSASGMRYIEGPGGSLLLIISGPSGLSYAPQQVAISVGETDTARKTVRLLQGVRLTGHVTAAGAAVAGAAISVPGLDYIHTITDNSGAYALIVSKDSNYTFRAARQGMVSTDKTQTLRADGTLDFVLGNAGFDITKLLGFPVQIDKIEEAAGGHKKLTGAFVNISGNALFSLRSGTKIPFSGVEVTITDNVPVPIGGSVTTDVTQLPLKALNFLPVKLTNNGNPLVVTSSGGEGQLQGMAAIDYAAFVPSGIAPYVNASIQQYVQTASSATPTATVVINSSGSLTQPTLAIAGASNQTFNLYGFTVTLDLAGSSLKTDGLHLKGSINLGSIPLLNNTTLKIDDLWIGTNGYIAGVSVNMNPAPTFSIAGWSATLSGLSFNDNGFSVSGNIKVQLPGSKQSEVDFANLSISVDQIFGGSFTLPSQGLDVFGVVKFLGGSKPLSFGKLGSSNVYYVGGSGTVQFPSLFGNLTLESFQIQTNGQFAATIPTNINQDFFGLASVTITQLGFHTNNGVGVDIQGNFLLKAIPFIKAQVGGVHFGPGGSFSVDDIGIGFDLVGIAKVSVNVQFANQPDKKGFSGSGGVTIAGLPGLDISFSYFKLPNGISLSAYFKANITIPIGVVSISNPGGGFSLDTQQGTWSVTISGDASITGFGTAVSVKNISVTISNGPVIRGTASLAVLTLDVADAVLLIDIPKSLFSITVNSKISLIPKVVTAEASSIFVLSGAKNDTYFMMGAHFEASLLSIFNANANLAAGWGLNTATHPEYAEYTNFIDPKFLDNGRVNGVFLQSQSNIGFHAHGDIYIASGDIWYNNYGLVSINMGLGAGNYALDIAASWDCGGSLSVAGIGNIASLHIGSDVGVHLDYINGCFSAGGHLAGYLEASIGNCDDDCFTGLCMHHIGPLKILPEGGKICAHPGLVVDYDCNSGFHLGLDL